MAMMNKAILVIDEDERTCKSIEAIEYEDYLVFTAPDGEIGITMAKKINPALIFINLTMIKMSGLEVCKSIHDTESLKKVPIVTLSAFQGVMDLQYTSVYGIVGSLKKPFTSGELITKTKQVLSVEIKPVMGDNIGAVETSAVREPDISEMQKKLDEAIRRISDSDRAYAGKWNVLTRSRIDRPTFFTIIIITFGTIGILFYILGLLPW